MNYDRLRDELAKERYNGLDDQAATDALNEATVAVRRPAATRDIFILAMRMGLILKLRAVVLDGESPAQLRALAQTALDLTDQTVMDSVDMDDPASMALLATLVQHGLMSDEQAATFETLGNGLISRAEKLGLGVVLPGHVQMVREGRPF